MAGATTSGERNDSDRCEAGTSSAPYLTSKRLVAFPLFTVRQRAIVIAHYPEALLDRLDEVKGGLRIQAEQERNQP